jgi:hypothetical protein
MPLVLDPEAHSVEQLRELVNGQRSALDELLPWFEEARPGYPDPMSLRTAVDLVADAIRAVDRLSGPNASRADLAAAANLGHSTVVAGVDLLKIHRGGPLVPRGRAAGLAGRRTARRGATGPIRPRRSSRAG